MKSFVSAPDLLIYLKSDVPNLVKKSIKEVEITKQASV
jgi:hypothetical protein